MKLLLDNHLIILKT